MNFKDADQVGRVLVFKIRRKHPPHRLRSTIRTEAQNERTLAQTEAQIDKEDGRAPEEDWLPELLVRLSADFEAANYDFGDAKPNGVPAFLPEQWGVKQADLLPLLGCSNGAVSDMLPGRREIARGTAKKPAAFFRLPVDWVVFEVAIRDDAGSGSIQVRQTLVYSVQTGFTADARVDRRGVYMVRGYIRDRIRSTPRSTACGLRPRSPCAISHPYRRDENSGPSQRNSGRSRTPR